MRAFLSWSGETSKAVAGALFDWLPQVIHLLKPWMSDHDIGAGAAWDTELAGALADPKFGVICLTRDCLKAPWIMFEAGALWKAYESKRVCPYLFRLAIADLDGPLSRFQSVLADEEGTKNLVLSINRGLSEPLPETRVEEAFGM